MLARGFFRRTALSARVVRGGSLRSAALRPSAVRSLASQPPGAPDIADQIANNQAIMSHFHDLRLYLEQRDFSTEPTKSNLMRMMMDLEVRTKMQAIAAECAAQGIDLSQLDFSLLYQKLK